MNILLPDSWLREYLDTAATPAQIKDCLSLCGPSVERINKVGNDYIYEIEITSNRVDMASVYGIAREAVAILPRFGINARLKGTGKVSEGVKDTSGVARRVYPEHRRDSPDGGGIRKELPLTVSDPNHLCDRLLAIVLEDINIGPSPDFISDRLEKSGVRSLNNVIDITNYLMLELGHPTHAFDYDRIKTGKLIIRRAKKGESLITLDNKKCELIESDVVIDDGTGRIIDLPGIIGTANSVVTSSTKRVIFFIESNNPVNIRRTSMRLALRTYAATINEKHPDPELAKTVLLRGIDLYQKIVGAKIASRLIDIYPNPPRSKKIQVTTKFINERLGVTLQKDVIIKILKSLSFSVGYNSPSSPPLNLRGGSLPAQAGGELLDVTPPSFRQFDVTIPEDIVEEVARIYGYHNLPARLMTGEIPIRNRPQNLAIEEKIKTILKYWGYTEVYNYSFISKELIEKAGLKTNEHLKVANPLTSEIEYMRTTLLPSMLTTISQNQHFKDNLSLFELAKIYLPQKNSLPDEISTLTIINQDNFYYLKGVIEALLNELGIADYQLKQNTNRFWHPNQSVSLVKDNITLGRLGKIHPELSQTWQIKNDLFLGELNVDMLVKLTSPIKKYTPISPYPEVYQDLTLVIPDKTQFGPVLNYIKGLSNIIKRTEIIDKYKNTITIRITYHANKKTLTEQKVNTVRNLILETLKQEFKITLKG